MGEKEKRKKTEPSTRPSWFYYVFIGGTYRPEESDDDPQNPEPQQILFKTKGLYFILGTITLFCLAPLFVMPSRIGFIPYSYAENFIKLESFDQYIELLQLNLFYVMKVISKIFPAVDSETFLKIFETKSSSAFWTGILTMVIDGIVAFLGILAFKVIKSNMAEYKL